MISFATQHPIFATAVLIALAYCVKSLYGRTLTGSAKPNCSLLFQSAPSQAGSLTIWLDQIRQIVQHAGSPRKAANQINREVQALHTLTDNELENCHEYFNQLANWCARASVENGKLDPKQEWPVSEWNRLFKAVGNANLVVKIASQERKRNAAATPLHR